MGIMRIMRREARMIDCLHKHALYATLLANALIKGSSVRAITPDRLPTEVLETSFGLGQLVLATRKARGLSQESLCESAEIGRSTLLQIERGSPRVQLAHWFSVLHALDLLALFRPSIPPSEMGRIARAVKRSGSS